MSKKETRRPRRWKRTAALLVLAAALGLGWYLRDLLNLGLGLGSLGLGPEAGETSEAGEHAAAPGPDPASGQAAGKTAGQDTAAAPPTPCDLALDSGGLTLDGKPARVADAVRACQQAGKARLHATGGARAGTYDDLMRALDEAGVPVETY